MNQQPTITIIENEPKKAPRVPRPVRDFYAQIQGDPPPVDPHNLIGRRVA